MVGTEKKDIYTVSRVVLTDALKRRVREINKEIEEAQEEYEKEVNILETKIKDLYHTSTLFENLNGRLYDKMHEEMDNILIRINNKLNLSSINTKEYDIHKIDYYDAYAFLRKRKFTPQDADFLCSLTKKVYDLAIAKHKFTDADEKLILTRREKINVIVNEDMLSHKDIILDEIKKSNDIIDVYHKILQEVSDKISEISEDIQELRKEIEELNENRAAERAKLLLKIDEALGEKLIYDGREFDAEDADYKLVRSRFSAQNAKFLFDELPDEYKVIVLKSRFENFTLMCIRKDREVFVLSS